VRAVGVPQVCKGGLFALPRVQNYAVAAGEENGHERTRVHAAVIRGAVAEPVARFDHRKDPSHECERNHKRQAIHVMRQKAEVKADLRIFTEEKKYKKREFINKARCTLRDYLRCYRRDRKI